MTASTWLMACSEAGRGLLQQPRTLASDWVLDAVSKNIPEVQRHSQLGQGQLPAAFGEWKLPAQPHCRLSLCKGQAGSLVATNVTQSSCMQNAPNLRFQVSRISTVLAADSAIDRRPRDCSAKRISTSRSIWESKTPAALSYILLSLCFRQHCLTCTYSMASLVLQIFASCYMWHACKMLHVECSVQQDALVRSVTSRSCHMGLACCKLHSRECFGPVKDASAS